MGKLIGRLIVVFALLAAVVALPAAAQDIFTGEPIANIRVEGNQRIEAETVLSYMQLSPGDRFEAARIDRALKNLFSSGLFADVSLRREGDDLVVAVVENPIINRLAFEGERDPAYSEEATSAYMRRDEIAIRADIGLGRGKATVWTCDLTKEYVEINGDYRS